MTQYRYTLSLEQPVSSCADCPLGSIFYDDAQWRGGDLEGDDLICLAKIDPNDIACSVTDRPHNCPLTFMDKSKEEENA